MIMKRIMMRWKKKKKKKKNKTDFERSCPSVSLGIELDIGEPEDPLPVRSPSKESCRSG